MTTTNIDNTPCIAANTTESSSEAEDDSTAAVEDDSAPKASANSSTELCGTLPNSSQLDPAPVVGYSHDVGRDNAQLAKCHANRSAVLFELGRYGDCCAEVDRALGTNDYPTETEWKLLARKARAAVHLRQFSVAEECIRCLESFVENFPDNGQLIASFFHIPSGGLTLIVGTQKWGFSGEVQRRPPADILLNESHGHGSPVKNR
jgi:hypothetical protein